MSEQLLPKPRTGNEDLLDYGNTPVEQLDDENQTSEPAHDFSAPGSYDRMLLADFGSESAHDISEIVDAPVEQLDSEPELDSLDTPVPTEQIPGPDAATSTARALQRMADRLENGALHVDKAAEYASDKKEFLKGKLRGFGRVTLRAVEIAADTTYKAGITGAEVTAGAALLGVDAGIRGAKRGAEATKNGTVKFGEVTGDAMIAGLKSVETSLDKAATTHQTNKFNRETNKIDSKATKDSAKELKAFDKQSAREAKALDKTLARDEKLALRENKNLNKEVARAKARYERAVAKQEAQDRRLARKAKRSSQVKALKNTLASGAELALDKYDNSVDRSREAANRSRRRAKMAKSAIRMGMQTTRDSYDAFKNA